MAVIDGRPAISYADQTSNDLEFVWATDTDGINWDSPVTVDSSGSVGTYTSLMDLNGYPAISYYKAGTGDLKYVKMY